MANASSRRRGEVWVIVQVIFLVLIAFSPSGSEGFGSAPLSLIGLLVGCSGLGFVVTSATNLGSNLTIFPRPKDDGSLTQTGLYAVVRHPIYCGVILGALGWAFFRGSLVAMLLTACLLIFFDRKAAREEIWLTEKYPEYPAYRQRTHKLIPFLY